MRVSATISAAWPRWSASPVDRSPCEALHKLLDLGFDERAYFAELLGRHFSGVGNLPVEPSLGLDDGALVAAAHCHRHVKLECCQLVQALGVVGGQVVAEFVHGL